MASITETNQQYYQGAQPFLAVSGQTDFLTTFDTDLVLGDIDPANADYALNNFKIPTNPATTRCMHQVHDTFLCPYLGSRYVM